MHILLNLQRSTIGDVNGANTAPDMTIKEEDAGAYDNNQPMKKGLYLVPVPAFSVYINHKS
jgi:hypothetical protein